MNAVRGNEKSQGRLIQQIEGWVSDFPGMTDPNTPVDQKYQPLISSIATTARNGGEVFIMGINPGMDSDFARGLLDWQQHLPTYVVGLFRPSSRYHSYLDYHPRGRVVVGFENMLGQIILEKVHLNSFQKAEWLRSIPVGNLFVRATHNAAELGPLDQELSSIDLLTILKPKLIVLMGSDERRMIWMANQGILGAIHRHGLPSRNARSRRFIIRSAMSSWGGHFLAVPHPNAVRGYQRQREIGAWLVTNWEDLWPGDSD